MKKIWCNQRPAGLHGWPLLEMGDVEMQIPTKNQPSRGRQPCLWGQDLADADGLGWIARNWVVRLDPDESSVIGPVLKKAPVAGAAGGACVILEEKGKHGWHI